MMFILKSERRKGVCHLKSMRKAELHEYEKRQKQKASGTGV